MNTFSVSVKFEYDIVSNYNSSMNKRPEITEQTRKNLCEAFWSLYAKKPLARITVREITDMAGYNRATFYHYYTDVPHLLETEEKQLLKDVEKLFADAEKALDAMDFSEQLGSLVRVLEQNNRYASALLSDHGDPVFVNALKEMIWPFINRYFVNVDETDSYAADLKKEYYLSGILGAVRLWLQNPKIEIDELIALLVEVIS